MSFFQELKRRNVFRVGIAYAVVGWLLMQITDTFAPALRLPEWFASAVAFLLLLGFPLALFFAWAFELTPEGIRPEKDLAPEASFAQQTGRKLDRLIIVVLVLAVTVLLYERFTIIEQPAEPTADSGVPAEPDETAPRALAVLPFDNLSADEENAFFAAGVHEDILTNLTRVPGLQVNSRTSVLQFADKQQSLSDIAQALGATYVLEGSVRRSGNRVRVTAQLIDARTDVHLWAANFDRELTDIFAIQTAIAREITDALKAEFSPSAERMIEERATNSIEAYDLFLQARLKMQDVGAASIRDETPVKLLEAAVEADPEYAQAWALLAVAHGNYYWFRTDPSPERLERMKHAVDQAFALQPDLPEARLALANYYYRGFYDYPRALEQLLQVRSVLPGDALVHNSLGLTYRRVGEYDLAIDSFLRATAIDPYFQSAWAEAAGTALSTGRLKHAVAIANEIERRFPEHPRMVAERALTQLNVFGDFEGAQRILDTLPELDHYAVWDARAQAAMWSRDFRQAARFYSQPGHLQTIVPGGGMLEMARALMLGGYRDEVAEPLQEAGSVLAAELKKPYTDNFFWPHMEYAGYLVMSGEPHAAIERCERAMAILPVKKDKVQGPQIARYCAWVVGTAGQTGRALDMLEELLQVGWGLNYYYLALSPEWDFLREEERFQSLLVKAKQKLEAQAET